MAIATTSWLSRDLLRRIQSSFNISSANVFQFFFLNENASQDLPTPMLHNSNVFSFVIQSNKRPKKRRE
jgi:hypothetical protein